MLGSFAAGWCKAKPRRLQQTTIFEGVLYLDTYTSPRFIMGGRHGSFARLFVGLFGKGCHLRSVGLLLSLSSCVFNVMKLLSSQGKPNGLSMKDLCSCWSLISGYVSPTTYPQINVCQLLHTVSLFQQFSFHQLSAERNTPRSRHRLLSYKARFCCDSHNKWLWVKKRYSKKSKCNPGK